MFSANKIRNVFLSTRKYGPVCLRDFGSGFIAEN